MSTIYMDIQNISPDMEQIDYDELVTKLARSGGTHEKDVTKYFENQWMPFAWAAILGFQENKRIPLEKPLKKDTFKYSTINNKGEKIFQALVLFVVAKEGYEVLKSPSKINKTIEEYANGGFEILYEKMENNRNYFNHPNDFLTFIIERI